MQSLMAHPIRSRTSMLLTLAAATAAVLGGCGGDTKTVSIANSPTGAQTTGSTTQPATSTAHAPAGTSTTGAARGGTTAPPTTTRTATEPAFAEKGKAPEGVASALAVVRAHGYTATDSGDYHPSQTLRVLVGTRTGSSDGYDQQAFFFVGGRYIGTDSSRPSAQVKVLAQSDTEVTLAYSLYRSSDPLCCPGGGQAKVRFQLNNGRLQPLSPIPPVNSSTGLGRQ